MKTKKKKSKKKSPESQLPREATLMDEDPAAIARQKAQQANEEFLKGDFKSAIDTYTKAIALSRSNPALLASLFTYRAKSRWSIKEYQKAVEDCSTAVQFDPQYIKAYICRGSSYLCMEKFASAYEDYYTASRLASDEKLKNNILAAQKRIAEKMRKWDATRQSTSESEHEQLLQEFMQGLEQEAEALSMFADVPLLVPVGEYSTAAILESDVAHPQKRMEQAMRDKEAGNTDFQDGNYLSALLHYTNAIKLFPAEPVFYSNRALVYLKLNRFEEAVADCTASLDRKPSIKAYARRATAWASLKNPVLAAEDCKRALKFEPRNQDCLQELQKCLTQIEEDCRAVLQENPHNERANNLLRRARDDTKKFINPGPSAAPPGAPSAASTTPTQQDPSSTSSTRTPTGSATQGTSSRTTSYTAEDEAILEELIEYSRKLESDRNDSSAYLGRGRAYLKRGEVDKALSDFRWGLKRDPDNVDLQQGVRTALAFKQQQQQSIPQQVQAVLQPAVFDALNEAQAQAQAQTPTAAKM